MYVSSKNASKCSPGVHAVLPCPQRVVDTQTEQQGHERIPLLAPFSLSDLVADPLFVLPHICCGLPACKSCKWQESLQFRDFQQLTEHCTPMDVIVSSYAVD